MSDSPETGEQPGYLWFDGILEGRVGDSAALQSEVAAINRLLPIRFHLEIDGGHFSVALYERIRGREADVRKLAPIAAAVVIFMVLLGVLAVYLDITDPLNLR